MSNIDGNQIVAFGNPAEADHTLVVYGDMAYIYVNGEYKATFNLAAQNYEMTEGYLLYAVRSGTNRGYGTRCEMTNVKLWKIK